MIFGVSRGFVMGFAVGFGTGFVARDLAPYVKDLARPLAKFTLKASVLMVERAREGLSRLGETVEDLAEEVKSDLRTRQVKMNAKRRGKVRQAGEAMEDGAGARARVSSLEEARRPVG